MERVELQIRITEPVTELGDLRAITIVQVLPGAEDFHERDARGPNPVKPHGGEAVIDEKVSGECAYHCLKKFTG
jgi:hypothetical protein